MEDRELRKLNERKENIKRYISRLYNTSSVTAESSITEDLIKEVKKIDVVELINLAKELDIFGKCVFHYRLPIDLRINIDFSKATEVPECDRLLYWKEYKEKLKNTKLNPEEEYNKIILMACTLHVPINDEDSQNEENNAGTQNDSNSDENNDDNKSEVNEANENKTDEKDDNIDEMADDTGN